MLRLPPIRTLFGVAATILVAVSGMALAGWGLGVRVLIQPVFSFPPIRPDAAAAFLIIGLAAWALAERQRRWAAIAGGAACLVGALALYAAQTGAALVPTVMLERVPDLVWGEPTPNRMSVASALIILLSGIAVAALAAPRRADIGHVVAGIAGTVVLALGFTVVLARAFKSLAAPSSGLLAGSSLQAAVLAVLLGLAVVAAAWERATVRTVLPWWLPFAASLASLATVLLVWQALVERERVQAGDQVMAAMRGARRGVIRQLEAIERAMRRTANFSTTGGLSDSVWQHTVAPVIGDLDGLATLVWYDSLGALRATVPAGASAPAPPKGLAAAARPATGDLDPMPVRYARIGGSDARLTATVPVCGTSRCGGMIVGVIDAAALVAPLAGDTAQGFQLTLSTDGDSSLAVPAAAAQWARRSTFRIGDAVWQLGVWPTEAALARASTDLPDLVLVIGLMVTALLPVTLRLAQTAWEGARLVERSRINLALERATDGLWEWNVRTGGESRSGALWRYLGYPVEAMRPHADTWTALIHPDDRARVTAALAEHVAGRTEAFEASYRIRAARGDWHQIVDRGRVVARGPRGEAISVMGISADVTEHNRNEEAMREVDTLTTMGRLAARVAHEINNPLAGIQNSFLLVKDAIPESHPHFRYVGAIEREIDRIGLVTRQLYETYRPERDGHSVAPVATVVGDAVAFLRQVNRSSGVTIEVDLRRAPALVPVPDAILRQCIYNLVQNAVEASPKGGEVCVEAVIEDARFLLLVRDQGPGVPAELRERIFEPFFSTKDASVRTGGMGLGLALVRRSIEAIGGRIEIREPPSGGTEFVLSVPLHDRRSNGGPRR